MPTPDLFHIKILQVDHVNAQKKIVIIPRPKGTYILVES